MTDAARPMRTAALQVCLVVAAALLAHAAALRAGFVQDDYQQILSNAWIREPGHLREILTRHFWGFMPWYGMSNYYRPLMHLLNRTVYAAAGPSTFWFHAVSLLLHAANCALLYLVTDGFCRRALPEVRWRPAAPLLAALLFAVHPVASEGVAFLGSVQDLLYCFFSLLTIWLHARRDPGRPAFLPAVAFLAALLGKETAVVVPAVLLAYDAAAGRLSRSTRLRPFLVGYLPYLAAGAVYLGARLAALGALVPVRQLVSGTAGGVDPLPGGLQALRWYLARLAMPVRYNFFPSLPPLEGLGGAEGVTLLLLVAALAAAAGFLVLKARFLLWPLALLLLPLVPPVAMTGAIANRMAERYLYLPATGFCVLLGFAFSWALSRPRLPRLARWALVAAVLIPLGVLSARRDAAFRDEIGLWRDAIAAAPHLPYAHAFLATAYFRAGLLDEGIDEAGIALTLDPTMVATWYDLGEALRRLGRFRESAEALEAVVRLAPWDGGACALLGRVYLAAGDVDRAISFLERAQGLGDTSVESHRSLGLAYRRAGRTREAVRELARAKALAPAAADIARELAGARAAAVRARLQRRHRPRPGARRGVP